MRKQWQREKNDERYSGMKDRTSEVEMRERER